MQIKELEQKAKWVRRQVLEMIVNAGKGHIGGSLSCVEILVALYYTGFLNLKGEDRDIFILSKGHACASLYAILADLGYFPIDELMTFAQEGSRLEAHPTLLVPGIEVSTGSLGHGLSIGTGIALADKMLVRKRKVVVLMSDGECHEGSVWEAAMFAAHHKLSNLIAIIDRNGLSVLDFISRYNNIEPLALKWKSFNWWVIPNIDGHSFDSLISALDLCSLNNEAPIIVIANTVKGKSISFMERIPEWHHRVPNKEELEIARRELSV